MRREEVNTDQTNDQALFDIGDSEVVEKLNLH